MGTDDFVDGAAGVRVDNSNLPDDVDWASYVQKVEGAAATLRSGADG